MKRASRTIGWALLLLAFGAAPAGCAPIYRSQIREALQTPATSGPARLEVHEGIPVVHLYGSPTEMAAQYGALLKPALQALSKYAHSLMPPLTLERFLNYARAQEPLLPDEIRRSLRAMTDAAGVPYMEFVAMNIVPRMMCTTLAVWGDASADRALVMGRNAEYFGLGLEDRGSLVVVFHSRDEPRRAGVVAVAFLGMLGAFSGINADGVAFGNLLVFNVSGPARQDGGLPIQLAMRLAAHQARSAEEMSAQLQAMRHAIPMNVMVADAQEALVLELGLNRHVVRRGKDGVLAASNRFREHPDRTSDGLCRRYDALISAARKHAGTMGVKEMEQALRAAQIPALNIQAIVFEPAAMRMHVSVNRCPAAGGPYVEFDVRKLLAVPPSDGGEAGP